MLCQPRLIRRGGLYSKLLQHSMNRPFQLYDLEQATCARYGFALVLRANNARKSLLHHRLHSTTVSGKPLVMPRPASASPIVTTGRMPRASSLAAKGQ